MKHPIQRIAYDKSGNGALYLAVSDRLQKIDTITGELVNEWIYGPELGDAAKTNEHISKKQKTEFMRAKNSIRVLICTSDGQFVVASTDEQKSVLVFTNDLLLRSDRNFPKRPSAIDVTSDNKTIILGDKFGDVYAIPLDGKSTSNEDKENDSKSSNESGSSMNPILGHVSMLVDLLITSYNNKEYIITSDRDEHIRITQYPRSYIIERFCFGHEQYVSQLLVPTWAPSTLLSGGGDDFIIHWDWTTGKMIEKKDIKSLLYPTYSEVEYEPIEVAVSGIWQIPEGMFILIYDECSRKLLIFRFREALEYLNCFDGSILDISATGKESDIWMSIDDTTTDQKLLRKFHIAEDGKLEEINHDLTDKIATISSFTIESRDQVTAVHSIQQLRKRAEH
ncbi:hypothetical protein V1511DRAFT_495967 [Dipodascopsis uninucleata]